MWKGPVKPLHWSKSNQCYLFVMHACDRWINEYEDRTIHGSSVISNNWRHDHMDMYVYTVDTGNSLHLIYDQFAAVQYLLFIIFASQVRNHLSGLSQRVESKCWINSSAKSMIFPCCSSWAQTPCALYKQSNRVWVQDNKSFSMTLPTGSYPPVVCEASSSLCVLRGGVLLILWASCYLLWLLQSNNKPQNEKTCRVLITHVVGETLSIHCVYLEERLSSFRHAVITWQSLGPDRWIVVLFPLFLSAGEEVNPEFGRQD